MRGGILTEQERIVNINIDLLIPNPYQPRKTFNEKSIKELAESIREYGILNPILVRKKNNIYEIVAGERRYRAAKSIGLNSNGNLEIASQENNILFKDNTIYALRYTELIALLVNQVQKLKTRVSELENKLNERGN